MALAKWINYLTLSQHFIYLGMVRNSANTRSFASVGLAIPQNGKIPMRFGLPRILNSLFILLLLSQITTSCSYFEPKKTASFTFDNQSYTLSTTVKVFQNQNHFKFGCDDGFDGESENFHISLQLEGYPIFLGDDGIIEKDWENEYVAGITFTSNSDTINISKIEQHLEIQYNKKFNRINRWFNKLETSEGIIIITSENRDEANISFYYGIKEEEIIEYLGFS